MNIKFSDISQNEKWIPLLFGLTLCGLMLFAWGNRFVQDDAFISFTYARNLAEGTGLVWNASEKVEGYTNFLWVLLLSLCFYFQFDPIQSTYFLGLLCFAGSLCLTYKLAYSLFSSKPFALLTLLLLGTNYTFSCYATGGLETQLQTFLHLLLCIQAFQVKESPGLYKNIFFSLLIAVALLNRLDSALFAGILFLWSCFSARKSLSFILSLFLPVLLIIGSWFFWKWFYYGNVVPNTFYIKFSASPKQGLYYLYLFFLSYGLFPFLFLCFSFAFQAFSSIQEKIKLLLLLLSAWFLYLVKIGGGFMEFRLMVPILPFLFLIIVWVLQQPVLKTSIRIGLILLLLFGSLHHYFAFGTTLSQRGIDTIEQLDSYVNETDLNWTQIGKILHEYFPKEKNITIAISAVGAIPFYSRLKTVDILGLNDVWVAHYGEERGDRPGHKKIATFDYLKERKVNLLIGNPWIKSTKRKVSYRLKQINKFTDLTIPSIKSLPPKARVLEIPLAQNYRLVVLYLYPDPIIEQAIQFYKWPQYKILP